MKIRQQILTANLLAYILVGSAIAETNSEQHPSTLTCGAEFTAIHAVQGSSSSSPMVGKLIEVEGLVTADFQESLGGFYLQSASEDTDAYSETSEGIFVDTGNTVHNIAVGNRVRFAAHVSEANEVTQLENVSGLTVCEQSVVLPSATPLVLPFVSPPENLEGMLVSFNHLTVNDVYHLGRFGTITLAHGRRFIPTQVAAYSGDWDQ